jgi:chromosome partitioning protein
MNIITIAHHKGGVGKTTTAISLAAALAERQQKVLLLDLDPKANATDWLGVPVKTRGIFSALCENSKLVDCIQPSTIPGLDIAPATEWLTRADQQLNQQAQPALILQNQLKRLPSHWSWLLIDTAPTLDMLLINTLVAAQAVLIPTEAHALAIATLVKFLRTIKLVQTRLNPDLTLEGILVCRADKRVRHSQEIITRLQQRFAKRFLTTQIRYNSRLIEAASFRQSIMQYATNSQGAQDYRALADELCQQRGLSLND